MHPYFPVVVSQGGIVYSQHGLSVYVLSHWDVLKDIFHKVFYVLTVRLCSAYVLKDDVLFSSQVPLNKSTWVRPPIPTPNPLTFTS